MKVIFLFCQLCIFLFFLIIAPQFIQGGDTAELVNASYHLYVPHPPGYPFYLWIQHFWTHYFNVGTVFWRASVLSIVFSSISLYLAFLPLRKSVLAIFFFLAFVTSPVVIETSVLPDVFSIHSFIISILGITFLYLESSKKYFFIPVLFFLGLANHHTTIFLIPGVFYSIYESSVFGVLKKSIIGFLIGFLLMIFLYLSLLSLNVTHPFSWGELNSFDSLWAHFLRKDYGTFSLSSNGAKGSGAFFFVLKDLFPYLGIFIYALFSLIKNKIWDVKLFTWSVVLLFCLLFPLMMNVAPIYFGKEVLVRFHLMPLLVLFIWIIYVLNQIQLSGKKIIFPIVFILPALFLNLASVSGYFDLRNDSLIEDYSRNLYSLSKKYRPSMVITDNDTSFFGIRYIQSFDPVKDISIVSLPLFFHPWYQTKISSIHPDFHLGNKEEVTLKKELFFEDQLLKPNLSKINFVMTKDYREGDWYRVTFSHLGRVVQQGTGIFFDNTPLTFKRYDLPVGAQAFTKGYLYYQYSHYYLAHGKNELTLGNSERAKSDYLKALEIVPFSYPALFSLCELDKTYKICVEDKMNQMDEISKNFYVD